MTILFYIVAALCLVIIQTTILPGFPLFNNFYDLLIPVTVYLGFFRPFHEGAPVVLFSGIALDSLSGAPFGLYSSTHIWLYFGARGIGKILHVRNYVLLPLMIGAGVLVENLLFLGTFMIMKIGPPFDGAVFRVIGVQVVWGAAAGTIFILLLLRFQTGIDHYRKERTKQGNGGESLQMKRR